MSEPGKGRIAIKFGTGSAPSTNKPQRPNPPSALGKRPRASAWGGAGSDSDNDDDDKRRGGHEAITGFGADGAETERKRKDPRTEKREYVIARQPNRDWKADAMGQRRGKNLLPAEARAQQNGVETVETEPADQDKGMKWGLTVKEKSVKDEDMEEDASIKPEPTSEQEDEKPPPARRTADDEAMDALLGREPKKAEAVIQPTETDAYQRDVAAAGEASTLADYEAMPVEEFGAALLRGMGWNGEERAPKPKEVKRRPNRLGLGAKELKDAEDLGGWNQGGKKKNARPRLDEYRREEAKRKERRRRDRDDDDNNSNKFDRERDRDRDRGSNRNGDRDRDRDRDREYDRHRDRHRGYDRDRRR